MYCKSVGLQLMRPKITLNAGSHSDNILEILSKEGKKFK